MTQPACWGREDARAIFVTEALEGNDSVFLATHSPIEGFDVGGTRAAEVASLKERGILEALSRPDQRHAFCVVQGEPGSGKSHLIRWLAVNWPEHAQPRDVKLLLRRADGSLEGALQQLKKEAPADLASLFEDFGQRQQAAPQGRADMFLMSLASSLTHGHFDPPLEDDAWCRDNAPTELVGHALVRNQWKGPARVIDLLDGAGGERNSQSASFSLFDVRDLARAARGIRGTGVTGRAEMLAERLNAEANEIDAYAQQGWTAEETSRELATRAPYTIALMDALNRRKNYAIQNVLGVSASKLKDIFRQFRRELNKRNARLVLLLEDITSWEGLDDSLIDVLVFNAEATAGDDHEPDVCPLVSVVGVTPSYYRRLQGNYRQRITHEVRLGRATQGLQDVAMLRDRSARTAFVSRYLSAMRAGLDRLGAWRESLTQEPSAPPPNACTDCPRQEECFEAFGQVEGVGLFPFTEVAITRFFEALKEDDEGQTWRTPRGLVQAVLNQNLSQPELLERGQYPGPMIETAPFREDRTAERAVSLRLRNIVENRVTEHAEQARMKRTLAYWGDPSRSDTTIVEGQLHFAGVRKSIFEAFSLPWIGEQAGVEEEALETSGRYEHENPPQPEVREPEPEQRQAAAAVGPGPIAPRPTADPRRSALPPKPRRVTRTELEEMQDDLRGWPHTPLRNPTRWNKILVECLHNLDTRKFGVSPYLYKRLVTENTAKLAGTSAGSRDYLVLEPEEWVKGGLEAYMVLTTSRPLSTHDAAFHRRALAVMMRRLAQVAGDYVRRRLPRLEDGASWMPVVTVAQVLLVRTWLRGGVAPNAPIEQQIRALFSDESEATSAPRSRCNPWKDWLTSNDRRHEALRSDLRSMTSLTISDQAGGNGLVDLSEVIPAIVSLETSVEMRAVPAEASGLYDDLTKACDFARDWNDKRLQLMRVEFEQLKGRALELYRSLRGDAVDAYLSRVDRAITQVSNQMKDAAPARVGEWKVTYNAVSAALGDGARARIEDLIMSVEEGSITGPPPRGAKRLDWLVRAPAKELEDVLNAAKTGEDVVKTLYGLVSECVHESAGGGFAAVQNAGRILRQAAKVGRA